MEQSPARKRWFRALEARDPDELHRSATPLELLFDLSFVVAIAIAASHLHHALGAGHVAHALVAYAQIFVAIWWAWMGFTWFASAYDNDDAAYRLKVFLQMAGVLVLAAGVPRAFEHRDFTYIVAGYVIMRVGLVSMWIRAIRADPVHAAAARRMIIGISVLQLAWIGLLFVPDAVWLPLWGLLLVLELAVPMWSVRAVPAAWHPHHIAERYGLMMIIVIGESILAATTALQAAIDTQGLSTSLVLLAGGALCILFALWWIYFGLPGHAMLDSVGKAFLWGYGHFVLFAAAAAVGAGVGVNVDAVRGHGALGPWGAGLCVAVPLCAFVVALAVLFGGRLVGCGEARMLIVVGLPLLVGAAALPNPVLWVGLAFVALAVGFSYLATSSMDPVNSADPAVSNGPDRRP